MSRPAGFHDRYGASPLHLLLVLASFALAAYAGLRLFKGDTLGVAVWFVGAALLHDLVLLPLYSATDRAAQLLFRGRTQGAQRLLRPTVNYVRVPVFVSGMLLLVWWPLVLRQVDHFTASTALSEEVFLGRWLLITAGLFAASALVLLARTWRRTRPDRREARDQARASKATK
ncbi:hypothetical protein [Streptomyces sp. H34-S4]|uniref:hypothetical protein n=1 Tax=Streptomyces sp. H34-S4 TaxID=2996463 RepID=UPI00226E84FA|nr:hypothetical protein [Streptomyces sp. H34-S4]MCY0937551.1 hypothetical protein [Streptomyces sp. H34-S4]